MKRTVVSILFAGLFLAALSASASAEVFERDWKTPGDGLLTYDDVNRREWLDVTETQLFKFPGASLEEQYQAVLAEAMLGGEFDQFNVATADDVLALAISTGIDTMTTDFQTNQDASDNLIRLLGDPISSNTSSNKLAGGYLADDDLTSSLTIAFLPNTRDSRVAGVISHSFLESDSGVWLYRVVPEPSAYVLIGIALVVLVLLRCRVSFAIT